MQTIISNLILVIIFFKAKHKHFLEGASNLKSFYSSILSTTNIYFPVI